MPLKHRLCPALLLLPMIACGASPKLPGVSAAMQSDLADNDRSGSVTVVVTKDKVVHLEAMGLADLAAKTPMRPDSVFWIASMTKPVTDRKSTRLNSSHLGI